MLFSLKRHAGKYDFLSEALYGRLSPIINIDELIQKSNIFLFQAANFYIFQKIHKLIIKDLVDLLGILIFSIA